LVKFIEFVVIGAIDWLSGTIGGIGEVPDSHRQQSQHRRPDDISSWSQFSIWVVLSLAAIGHQMSQG
jgi:hypothetical protein